MKYFTLKELTRSDTASARGIDNSPTKEAQANLEALVDNVLDPLREAWGKPLTVTSGYRSPKLNKAVGGSSTSDHLKGRAADIKAGSRADNKRLFELVQRLGLPYDQLIHEHGSVKEGPDWVHVSYRGGGKNRRQILYIKEP